MKTDYSPSWCSEVNGFIRGVNLVNHASLQMVLLGIWFVALFGNGFVASLKIVTLKIITFSTEYKNVCLLFFSFQIPLPRKSLRRTRFVVPLFLNNIIFLVMSWSLRQEPLSPLIPWVNLFPSGVIFRTSWKPQMWISRISFCRGRHRICPKCVLHVQLASFSFFHQSNS